MNYRHGENGGTRGLVGRGGWSEWSRQKEAVSRPRPCCRGKRGGTTKCSCRRGCNEGHMVRRVSGDGQGEWRLVWAQKGDGVSGWRAGQKLLDARLHTFSLGPVDPSLELGGVDPRCVEECGGTATAEGLPVGIPRGEGGEGGTSKGKSEEGPTLPGGRTWDACSGCWSAGKAETQAVPVDVSGGDQDSF